MSTNSRDLVIDVLTNQPVDRIPLRETFWSDTLAKGTAYKDKRIKVVFGSLRGNCAIGLELKFMVMPKVEI